MVLLDSDFWSLVKGIRLELSSLGTKQVAWEYRHGQSKVSILLCVGNSTLQHVFKLKHKKKAWDTLQKLYATKNVTIKTYLSKYLYSFRMIEKVNIIEHTNRFKMLSEITFT